MTEFVHLHNHTDFSLLDGAAPIKKYMSRAKELGMKALAITDHGNMFGVMDFYNACKANEIQPIIGCEFYISPAGRKDRDPNNKYYHLILLACSDRGYHNLMELNSIGWTEGLYYSKPRIDKESLFEHQEGLICCSACLAGEVPQKLLSANPQEAYEVAKQYKEVFGDRYYIEIQNHGIEDEITVLPKLAELARTLDIPLVATNDIHYINKDDARAHEVLLCIGTGARISDERHMKFETEEFYMKSPDEMAELFKDYPEAIENTVKIAERCKFDIQFPGPLLPEVTVPEGYKDTVDFISRLAWTGLERRYPGYRDNPEQKEVLEKRLNYELGVIIKMHFDSYFLIVRDYIRWAKDHQIPVGAGRGSGAGSLVAYCIDITNVDPISHDLLFERFLNPDRISLPDFDVDFCYEGRQDVIDYVTEKYGKDRVGQIATFGTLKAKAVVKDVARVLDIPFDEANHITKLIPDVIQVGEENKKVSLPLALEYIPELRAYRDRGGVYEELFDISSRLENLSRHVSTHACGVVIGRTPLKDYVPLCMDQKTGAISTQYTMTYLEDCGLVKMDFLGLKTLTLIKNTQRMIRKKEPSFDIEKIPDNDRQTFEMMSQGKSKMVFQFESPGMQKNLKLLAPERFEELDAMTSLYRPGPMQFIPKYIDSKHGRQPIVYPDPSLKELLEPTYGVIVYQEQVMKVAQIYAGFTLGQADILRKIMGKKKKHLLPEQEKKFIEGAVKNGHTEQEAKDIFDMLAPFAGYGFNKSHSVCYTVLSYRTAYLKAHYPAEFYAANLTNEISSGDKFKEYLDYVRSEGIKILSPDINKSEMYFNVDGQNIVYGLAGIKGMGSATVELILSEREKNGPYKDFLDFVRRSDNRVLGSATMEGLIESGAFDSFGYNRPTLIANYNDAIASVKEDRESAAIGQNFLFGAEEEAMSSFKMRTVSDYEFIQKLETEKKYLGLYLSGHPLDVYKNNWEECVRLDLSKPERIKPGVKYDFIGMITDFRAITAKSGSRMGYVTIEDYNGHLEITFFPKQWSLYEAVIDHGKVFGFRGSFKEYNNRMSFSCDALIADPSSMKPSKPVRTYIGLDASEGDRQAVIELRNICKKYPGSAELELQVYSAPDEDGNYSSKPRRILADARYCVDGSSALSEELMGCTGVHYVYSE
ncbi:MAG: DNA polymerase III subunit alpha [Sphaerochaetaceae bacterium]|nr:DNA polymerase III subunit alpha [Sphaerochaetaceae bacterium]